MMKLFNLVIIFAVVSGCISKGYSSHKSDLTDERISTARSLVVSDIKFEPFVTQEKIKSPTDRGEWLTIEPSNFTYKGTAQKFCMINGFNIGSSFGEIAVYNSDVKLDKVTYSFGRFNDIHELYLSTLQYEYKPAADSHPAYFIVEKVEAGFQAERHGYTQAALNYFIKEFVLKRTNVQYVFSDLRNPICKLFFPKYGFSEGVPTTFKDVKFARPMRASYTWVKK